MRCIAVISEFNPFHNGHGHLFDEIRRRTEDECVLCCVMSGNFTQRGDCALFAKSERAAMAADEGADLVVELPFPWSMASAEFFARAGVAIAAAMGADTLAFGAETPDDTLFDRIGKILADDAFTLKLTGLLRAPKSRGIPYAILRQQLLMQLLPDITSDFFRSPNNILGLEYSRAIHSRKDPIALMSIPRAGGSYHGPLTQHAYFAGASAIRAQLAEGDFDRVRPYLPRDTFDRVVSLMQSGQYSRGPEVLWPLLAHRLLTGSETGIAENGGGLSYRLRTTAAQADSYSTLLSLCATKQYTHAHIRRAVLFRTFGITSSDLREPVAYTQVLACSPRGRRRLKELKRNSALTVLTRPGATRALPEQARRQAERTLFSDGFWGLTLCTPRPPAQAYYDAPYRTE